MAERYGISDDGCRTEMLTSLDEMERQQLIEAVEKYDEAFDEWLAGPAAYAEEFSNRYVPFPALRMAADEA